MNSEFFNLILKKANYYHLALTGKTSKEIWNSDTLNYKSLGFIHETKIAGLNPLFTLVIKGSIRQTDNLLVEFKYPFMRIDPLLINLSDKKESEFYIKAFRLTYPHMLPEELLTIIYKKAYILKSYNIIEPYYSSRIHEFYKLLLLKAEKISDIGIFGKQSYINRDNNIVFYDYHNNIFTKYVIGSNTCALYTKKTKYLGLNINKNTDHSHLTRALPEADPEIIRSIIVFYKLGLANHISLYKFITNKSRLKVIEACLKLDDSFEPF